MIRRGKRKGELAAKVRPEVREQLKLVGRERALIYKTLVLTGLRKGELTSLTIGQLHLEGDYPHAELNPQDEKNREGSQIALRHDLAAEMAAWIADKGHRAAEGCIPIGGRGNGLEANTPLYDMPDGLLRILDRDLIAAGIPKKDERGRTVDVHAMRHSFGTLLSKGGVAPRTAQAAMRHSTIDLTMNVYTDPKLLDVHGALDALPALLLNPPASNERRATGTTDTAPEFAPGFAPKARKPCQMLAKTVEMAVEAATEITAAASAVTLGGVKENQPVSMLGKGCQQVETKGLEPSTPALQRRCSPN
jgi:hypothetical protein